VVARRAWSIEARARRGATVAAAALALGGASDAEAEVPSARTASLAWLRLPAAESCIGARDLALRVERRLGRAVFTPPTGGDIAVEGRIERIEARSAWHASLAVRDEAGHVLGVRDLERAGADCHAIDDELELVLALLIDPRAPIAPPPASPRPLPAAPVSPLAAPLPASLPLAPSCPPAPPQSAPWRGGVEAGPVVGFGLLPSTAGVGIAIRAHLAPPRGPAYEIGGAFWFDSHANERSISAIFSLAYGWASVCPVDALLGRTRATVCVGVQLGSLRADGTGLATPQHQEQLFFEPSLDARVRQRIVGPLFAGLGAALAVPTIRDRYYFTDAQGTRQDLFQAAPITGLLDLALGLELP